MSNMTDDEVVAMASQPATVTSIRELPHFREPSAWRYTFYVADAKGATPLEWRCEVHGPGVFRDYALSDPRLASAAPEALLARLHQLAVGEQ